MAVPLRRWILPGLVVAVVLVVVLVVLSGRQPVPRVTVVRLVRENLNSSITSNGKVEPITPYAIKAQLNTFVEKVYAVEGQAVQSGQLLLTLNANDARAELAHAREQLIAATDDLRAARAGGRTAEAAQLESDLRKTQAERDRLRREHEALERLVAKQAATRDELDQNQFALSKAEAELQRLQRTREDFTRRAGLDVERASLRADESRNLVRALEEKVRSTRVVAPVSGTLYSLPVREREFVKVGDPLAELADLRQVRVRAFIDEAELGQLEPGQKVEVNWDAYPNRTWIGQTGLIPKQVVPHNTRSVGEVLCSVDNSKLELLPNINVNVRIHLRQRANALVVPRGAVRTEGARHYVFVVEEGSLGVERRRLQKREISVGIGSATNYEVLGGLHEGETIALPGDVEFRDGMSVRVVNLG